MNEFSLKMTSLFADIKCELMPVIRLIKTVTQALTPSSVCCYSTQVAIDRSGTC
jgi:hypothetical protein